MRRRRWRGRAPVHAFVVAYDIQDDRTRARLHERLRDFGVPVQYSVFECPLTQREFVRMQAMIRRIVTLRSDRVRIYRLCTACRGKVESLWGRCGESPADRAALVV